MKYLISSAILAFIAFMAANWASGWTAMEIAPIPMILVSCLAGLLGCASLIPAPKDRQ